MTDSQRTLKLAVDPLNMQSQCKQVTAWQSAIAAFVFSFQYFFCKMTFTRNYTVVVTRQCSWTRDVKWIILCLVIRHSSSELWVKSDGNLLANFKATAKKPVGSLFSDAVYKSRPIGPIHNIIHVVRSAPAKMTNYAFT